VSAVQAGDSKPDTTDAACDPSHTKQRNEASDSPKHSEPTDSQRFGLKNH
jgi:hypothetical protein